MPSPTIDAVAVASRDLARSVAFYSVIGFSFPPIGDGAKHVEADAVPGAVRLMIDEAGLLEDLNGEAPVPATHSVFALRCASPAEVDAIAERVKRAGHAVLRGPWDAVWGQRYAILADPDGTRLDLFAPL
jgi:predicted enzyme related to lactoylglutathione lyase